MFKDNLLAGRRILVTGGGTGLGKAMAARFLQLGAELQKPRGHRLAEAGAAAGDQDASSRQEIVFEHDVRRTNVNWLID